MLVLLNQRITLITYRLTPVIGIVSIKESNGLTVADSSVSGQLDLTSAGAISLNRLDADKYCNSYFKWFNP